MGLNPGTPRHGRECGACPLNGRIIEDELGNCQLVSLWLVWFNLVQKPHSGVCNLSQSAWVVG